MTTQSDDSPTLITKQRTFIQLGVAVAMGGVIFLAGATYEKVNRLDGIKIEENLGMIRADLALIKFKLGLSQNAQLQLEYHIPDRYRPSSGHQGISVYR